MRAENVAGWLVLVAAIITGALTIAAIVALLRTPALPVARYRCIITVHDEVLCFEPNGAMFRPEKRFNQFTLEVPAKGKP